MSRSYRKPWIKDNANGLKQVCSRMHRRIARQICKTWVHKYKECWGYGCEYELAAPWDDDEPDNPCGLSCRCKQFITPMEPTFPIRKELVDQYDICDWKMYRPNEPYYYRK